MLNFGKDWWSTYGEMDPDSLKRNLSLNFHYDIYINLWYLYKSIYIKQNIIHIFGNPIIWKIPFLVDKWWFYFNV